MTRPLRVAFATLGCKVNQYDTATMQTALAGDCEMVPFAEGADVYVVNSCTVTDRADAESRQLARRARRLNPTGRVILTGCFAQTSPQRAGLPEVDYVIGVGRLPDILRAVHDQIPTDEGRVLVSNLRKAETVTTLGAETFAGQTRAFLKVQEGCNLFCTFCIVPMARGRSRSVEPRRVLAELERLAALGYQEAVLTGIHLGGYGKDLTPSLTFADLVEMIAEAAPLPRIRLSSIDPPEVTLRVNVRSDDRRKVDRMGSELASLLTSGPPGLTGFAGGRPRASEIISFWPALISKPVVQHKTTVQEVA